MNDAADPQIRGPAWGADVPEAAATRRQAPPTGSAPTAPAAQPQQPPQASPPEPPVVPAPPKQAPPGRSRLGSLWVMLVSGAAVLILLLVFVLMNSQRVEIHFFGAHLNIPVGVALLMAAALGVLLVVVPGAGRIIQLRRAARREHERATALQRQRVAEVAAAQAAQPAQAAPQPTTRPSRTAPPAQHGRRTSWWRRGGE